MSKKHVYLVDTKLLAYFLEQRGSSISGLFDKIADYLFGLPKGSVYLCWDIGKSSHRTAISPSYKGHRAKEKEKKSLEEQEALKKFNEDYVSISELADKLNVHNFKVQGVEADDLASMICEKYKNNSEYIVYVLTGDYDYFHLVVGTNNVFMLNVNDGGMSLGHDEAVEKYNLDTRRKFSVLKSIAGDKSDNIKFCRNLGPVKAQEVFDRVYDKHKDPTDGEIVKEIEMYLDEKETHRATKKLKTSITVHEDHTTLGRKTAREAFLANMSIADPFTDTSLLSPVQIELYNQCKDRVPPSSTEFKDFMMDSIDVLGYAMSFGYKASKVFKVE